MQQPGDKGAISTQRPLYPGSRPAVVGHVSAALGKFRLSLAKQVRATVDGINHISLEG